MLAPEGPLPLFSRLIPNEVVPLGLVYVNKQTRPGATRMAAASVFPAGGGQLLVLQASKSGLEPSPGRLAAGGVRAAFKRQAPSKCAAPQTGEARQHSVSGALSKPTQHWCKMWPAHPPHIVQRPLFGQQAGGLPAGVQDQQGCLGSQQLSSWKE